MEAFTQLLDRGIAAEGTLAAWCPTMDLLALATADGQLHLHRLNWQRLWWTSPDAAITGRLWGGLPEVPPPPSLPLAAAAAQLPTYQLVGLCLHKPWLGAPRC